MPGVQGSAGLVVEPKKVFSYTVEHKFIHYMLKTPFLTSELLVSKVRALLGIINETDFGLLTNDKLTALTSSLRSAFFTTGYKVYSILIRSFPYCLQVILIAIRFRSVC